MSLNGWNFKMSHHIPPCHFSLLWQRLGLLQRVTADVKQFQRGAGKCNTLSRAVRGAFACCAERQRHRATGQLASRVVETAQERELRSRAPTCTADFELLRDSAHAFVSPATSSLSRLTIQTHNVYPLHHISEKKLFPFNICRFSFLLQKAKKERLG
jgi:hypothetical protein